MTVEIINELKEQIDGQAKQLQNLQNVIRNLAAERDSSKQTLHDQTANLISVRANLLLFQQANEQYVQVNTHLNKEIETLKAQNATLASRLLELEPKLKEVPKVAEAANG